MKFRSYLSGAFALGACIAVSQAQIALTGAANSKSPVSYTGPGDKVASSTEWYGVRAYNGAYASALGKSVNARRASDSVACDINVAATGSLGLTVATCNSSASGGLSPVAFAGTDATASCTIASTTATCTGASSTPHVGSTVAGSGLTQPCVVTAVGTFTGAAGSMTVEVADTTTTCGTVGSAETLTMTYGLFVTEIYDQTGNGNHLSQATTANQPQLLPNCIGSLYCVGFGGSHYLRNVSIVSVPTTLTMSLVKERMASFTSELSSFSLFPGAGSAAAMQFGGIANEVTLYAGTPLSTTASDSVLHALQVVPGTSGIINVDGSESTGTSGAGSSSTELSIGSNADASSPFVGYLTEAGIWSSVLNSTNRGLLCHNQAVYWGITATC